MYFCISLGNNFPFSGRICPSGFLSTQFCWLRVLSILLVSEGYLSLVWKNNFLEHIILGGHFCFAPCLLSFIVSVENHCWVIMLFHWRSSSLSSFSLALWFSAVWLWYASVWFSLFSSWLNTVTFLHPSYNVFHQFHQKTLVYYLLKYCFCPFLSFRVSNYINANSFHRVSFVCCMLFCIFHSFLSLSLV